MKEIQLCWRSSADPAPEHVPTCGTWLGNSPKTLKIPNDLQQAGSAAFGAGSHWISEREI